MKKIDEMTAEEALSILKEGCAQCPECKKRFSWERLPSYQSGALGSRIVTCDNCLHEGLVRANVSFAKELMSRLDQLVEASGISISNGSFRYNGATYYMVWKSGPNAGEIIPAMEQQAIQNWLLRKAGLK